MNVVWDRPGVHGQLLQLMIKRGCFRFARTLRRIGSTQRLVATALAGLFFITYILSGIFILATREPADPERLRLWFSGGMMIYLIYHSVRCVWAVQVDDLELTSAESLWLGNAPLRRSSLTVYHVNNVISESMLKALLLSVIVARDVDHFELLLVGLVASLVLLQIGRMILQRLISGLDSCRLAWARFFATLTAGVLVLQVLARIVASTPLGSPIPKYVSHTFHALGQTAACDVVQWLSLPWWPASRLIVTQQYDVTAMAWLVAMLAVIPVAIRLLIQVDAWAQAARLRDEQLRYASNRYQAARARTGMWTTSQKFVVSSFIDRLLPAAMSDIAALIHRQVITARRYRTTVLLSFVVPALLCLSPLATGQIDQEWLFVVGGVALCTVLLAPPALHIDFRRDLKRMMLLRSLPVHPRTMVLGQLAIPISITLIFQWTTIAIAAVAIRPGWSQTVMWTGMLSALAVVTFATENALFLTYPHHRHRQGVSMMIRAKLVFLGKVMALTSALAMLLIWIHFCSRFVFEPIASTAIVLGPIVATWLIAVVSVGVTTWCWRRFDLERDIPPQ